MTLLALVACRATAPVAPPPPDASAELLNMVDAIRVGVIGYDAAFDDIRPCGPVPRPVDQLDAMAIAWPEESCLDRLWRERPQPTVRGTYQVEVVDHWTGDFVVHGWADTDQDGVPAYFTAGKDHRVQRQSAPHIR